jgi:hypothetical protein
MKTELAYNYATVARILSGEGWTEARIIDFLKKHQNATGYIKASLLP